MTATPVADTDVRARIVTAARELYVERGFANVSWTDVVTRAGTQGKPFPKDLSTRELLFTAAFDDCWRLVNERIDAKISRYPYDPRAVIIERARIIWQMCEENPRFGRMLLANCPNFSNFVPGQEGGLLSAENGMHVARIEEAAMACVSKERVKRLNAKQLRELALSYIDGIMVGWLTCYLEPSTAGGRISLDDAMRGLEIFLEMHEPK